jgi:hypothetical protein
LETASTLRRGLRASQNRAASASPLLSTIQIQGKVGVEFADFGEQALKNITRPVRVYALVPNGSDRVERQGPLSPPRLSIVVLPFANLNGDPEQDYFVDGVTDTNGPND